MPTAPIGTACPNCPTTAVSTAPNIGTVAFDKTTGTAIYNARLCVRLEEIDLLTLGFPIALISKK